MEIADGNDPHHFEYQQMQMRLAQQQQSEEDHLGEEEEEALNLDQISNTELENKIRLMKQQILGMQGMGGDSGEMQGALDAYLNAHA